MLPRVRAELLLDLHEVIASATGHMKPAGRRSLINRLKAEAGRKQKAVQTSVHTLPIRVQGLKKE